MFSVVNNPFGVSVTAVGAVVRALRAIHHDRALYSRLRREREMTHPEDKVGPLAHGDNHAYSFDNSLFEMKAGCFYRQEFNAHTYNLTESGAAWQPAKTQSAWPKGSGIFPYSMPALCSKPFACHCSTWNKEPRQRTMRLIL